MVFPARDFSENVQGEDVLILGCDHGAYIEARLITFPNMNKAYLSDRALEPCADQD